MLASLPDRRAHSIRGSLAVFVCCAAPAVALAIQDPAPESAAPPAPPAEQVEEPQMPGVPGPIDAQIGKLASIKVPEGFQFLNAPESQAALEGMGNPSSGTELGMVYNLESRWFVLFEYSETGHIKDEEKDKLDADELLSTIRKGNELGNEERKRRGWPTIEVQGWAQPPHYDDATKNLEWATYSICEGERGVNHNTRILGRVGVMKVTLVCSAQEFESVLPIYRPLLAGFDYKSGQRYSEVQAGDKIAEYGLTALVAGGAGVLAAKAGLFSKLWKFIVIGAVAVGAFIKRLFGRKSAPNTAAE